MALLRFIVVYNCVGQTGPGPATSTIKLGMVSGPPMAECIRCPPRRHADKKRRAAGVERTARRVWASIKCAQYSGAGPIGLPPENTYFIAESRFPHGAWLPWPGGSDREVEPAETRDIADLRVPGGLRGRHGRQQHDRYARWKSRSCASGTSAERQWRRVKRRQRRRLRDMARQLPAEYWPPRWRVYNLCARPILTDGFGSAPAETFGRREWHLPGSACSRTAIPLTASPGQSQPVAPPTSNIRYGSPLRPRIGHRHSNPC